MPLASPALKQSWTTSWYNSPFKSPAICLLPPMKQRDWANSTHFENRSSIRGINNKILGHSTRSIVLIILYLYYVYLIDKPNLQFPPTSPTHPSTSCPTQWHPCRHWAVTCAWSSPSCLWAKASPAALRSFGTSWLEGRFGSRETLRRWNRLRCSVR